MPAETVPEDTVVVSRPYLARKCAVFAGVRCPRGQACQEMCGACREAIQLVDELRVVLRSQEAHKPRRARLW